MFRRGLLLALSSVCWSAGCGGNGELERSDPASAAGSGSSSPSVPSASTVPSTANTIDASGELLLDDLSDGDARFAAEGIVGEWFTYSDGTTPITPPDHTGLNVVAGESHISGQGFSDWGAGLSAYFRSADLSRFARLLLRARGNGSIVVELATPATSPANEGGTCVGSGCFGHFAAALQLTPEYQEFDLAFASMTQPSWAQPATLSLAQVISINLVAKATPAAPIDIDLWIDRVALHLP
jgi:hypothetical protein